MIGFVLSLALDRSALTLDQAVHAAASHQPQIVAAHAQTAAARDRSGEALAPMLPQVVASASYERGTGNRTLRIGSDPRLAALLPPESPHLYDYWRFQVAATQLVFDFGQSYHRYASARALEQAQALAEKATVATVVLAAQSAFFQALAERQIVDVSRQALSNQLRHLAQVEAFVQAKARPDIDLAQSRLDVANAEVALTSAQTAYDAARAQLNQAMGLRLDHDSDYDVVATEMPPVRGEDGPADLLVEEALRARPEIASLAQQVAAQEALVRAAWEAFGPSLSVTVGANDIGGGLDYQLRWNYQATATVTWTLFDGALTPYRVAEARSNLEALDGQIDNLRLATRTEVIAAQLGVLGAKAAALAAGRAVHNADERLRLAEGRYAAGAGDAIELGDAIVAQAAAGVQRAQTDYALATARAQLNHALGRAP
jgi:outer membrane protein